MKEILKYLGVLVMLIGVVVLALYHFGDYPGNGLLITAGVLVVVGAAGHILLNKYVK